MSELDDKLKQLAEQFSPFDSELRQLSYERYQEVRRLTVEAREASITPQALREILDDGLGGVGGAYIDVNVDWAELAEAIRALALGEEEKLG